jgi:hypothetical protein
VGKADWDVASNLHFYDCPSFFILVLAHKVSRSFDMGQRCLIGVLPIAGMNSTDKEREEKHPPPRDLERMLEEYIAALRAIIDKLRRKLN